jgi:hypothetical protein
MIRRYSIWAWCAIAAAALLPSAASAGQYTVTACTTNGVNNSWETFRTNDFAAAYVECPGGVVVNGHMNQGMVAHSTVGPGLAPYFSHARVFFDAPPGAKVIRVNGEINQSSGSGGWLAGVYDETGNKWASCTLCGTNGSWVRFGTQLSAGRVSALAMCAQDSGCARDRMYAYVAIRNVEVVVSESSAPNIAIRSGNLVAAGWRAGTQNVVVDAADPVGIRRVRLLVDGLVRGGIQHACDATRAVQCANGADTFSVDTRIPPR